MILLYNSGMIVIAFNGVYLIYNTSLTANCQLTNSSRLSNWILLWLQINEAHAL